MESVKPIADEVVDFIAGEAGVPADSITRETRIWHDLHLCGDDAVEVFTRYRDRFGVDLTGLRLVQHGPSEGTVWLVEAWAYLARVLRFLRVPQYVPITVNDLIRAAEARTWSAIRN